MLDNIREPSRAPSLEEAAAPGTPGSDLANEPPATTSPRKKRRGVADIPHLRPSKKKKKRRLSPLVADGARLGKLLTAGLRTIRAWDAAGKLPKPTRIGGKVVWVVAEIREWLAAGAPDREAWTAYKSRGRSGSH